MTADELAEHLGVQTWGTTVTAEPGSYVTFVLYRIVDGKKAEGLGAAISIPAPGGKGAPNIGNHLAVMVGPVNGKSLATITYNGASTHWNVPDNLKLPLQACSGLPDKIPAYGDYVLGGEYRAVNGRIICSGKIEDVKDGLLLVLIP